MNFLSLETVEIFVGSNARFDYYNLEESTEKTTRISALYLRQEAEAMCQLMDSHSSTALPVTNITPCSPERMRNCICMVWV